MRCFSVSSTELGEKLDVESTLKLKISENIDPFKNLNHEEFVLLKDIATLKRGPFGGSVKKEIFVEDSSSSYQVYEQYNAINNDPYRARYYISESDYQRLSGFKVEVGDILMSCSGTIGKLVRVPKSFRKGIINQALLRIRLNKDGNMLPDFFMVAFGFIIQKLIDGNELSYGSAIKNIASVKELKEIQIPLPPLETQQQIIDIMDTAYRVKKQKETEGQRLLDSIDDYVLSELGIELPEFEHKMCFSVRASEVEGKRSDPSCFHPIHVKTVSAISSVQSTSLAKAVKFRRELVSEISEKDIYVGLENILSNDGKYVKRDIKSNISSAFRFKKGDVLFPKLRPYLNKVSYAQFNGICSTEFHVLKAELCDPFFLFLFLRNKAVLEQTSRLMTGNTLPRLQTDDVKNLIVPTPDLNIQQKLVNHCQNIYLKREKLLDEAGVILQTAKAQVEKIILGKKI